jgi:predicted transcriptional regulator
MRPDAPARAARAWEMHSQGATHHEISIELGISRSGVSKLLARIERDELRRAGESLDTIRRTTLVQCVRKIEGTLVRLNALLDRDEQCEPAVLTASIEDRDDDEDLGGR